MNKFRNYKKLSILIVYTSFVVYLFTLIVFSNRVATFLNSFKNLYQFDQPFFENVAQICSDFSFWFLIVISIIVVTSLIKFIFGLTQIGIAILQYKFNSKQVSLAYTKGILRPKVYIDEKIIDKLSPEELQSIKLHEEYHQKSFDPLIKTTIFAIDKLTIWIPYKNWFFNKLALIIELAADEYAIEKSKTKTNLISSLMKVINYRTNSLPAYSYFSSARTERIKVLTNNQNFKFVHISVFFFIMYLTFSSILIRVNAQTNSSLMECTIPSDCASFETNSLTCDQNYYYNSSR